jgi:hypothetical protein
MRERREYLTGSLTSQCAESALIVFSMTLHYLTIRGGDEDSAPSDPSMQTPRLRLEAMEPGMAVRHVGTLLGVPRILSAVELGSRSSLIGPIILDVKCAGARSAGNPHATCDVAGAGNRHTVRLVRHSQRKRGATDRPDLRSDGASPRPYRGWETGRRSGVSARAHPRLYIRSWSG